MRDDDRPNVPDEETNGSSLQLGRRRLLKMSGVGAMTVLGAGSFGVGSAVVDEGGPQNQADWNLALEDNFDSGTLDSNNWGIGFGWGRETNGSPERIVDENVEIRNNQLHLTGTHDGNDIKAGGVHSRGKQYFGPGSYWEAKIKMPDRVGFLPAFWAKPNDESWPPEIDFVELFQTGDSYGDTHVSHHHIHYSSSGVKGDSSTHEDEPASYDVGEDLSQDFHIYGCQWMEDRVVHYVDGIKVAETTDPTIMTSLNNGAPFYMMLNIHIDRIGTTDRSESWGESMVVDWVRVWEYAPGSGTTDSTQTTTDSTSTTSSTDTEHYIWVRSADGSEATYEFHTTGGEIRIDPNEQSSGESDEWISADGTSAGGSVSGGSLNGDGFYFFGEVNDLAYTGPFEVYIDDQPVDADSLVTGTQTNDTSSGSTSDSTTDTTTDSTTSTDSTSDSTSSTSDSTSSTSDSTSTDSTSDTSGSTTSTEHYVWVRSGDGSEVTYAFEVSGGDISIDPNEQSSGESDEWISADGTIAGGTVSGGSLNGDGFWFRGEIIDLQYTGPLQVYVDDSAVDPQNLVDAGRTGPVNPDNEPEPLPNVITIDGSTSTSPTAYSVSVSDAIQSTDSLESTDSIDGATATGEVDGDQDQYRFSGTVESLTADANLDVTINGTDVNLLVVERSPDSSGTVNYIIETDAELLAAEVGSANVNTADDYQNGKAFGSVSSGADAYWVIGGSVVDVSTFGGSVVTTYDGTETDFTN
ncbi:MULTISPECIES: family 16 glycosylhydrolase [Haloferax]|uniref:Family 16 glycosylhydrolase n=2 Tax=Haloferax TaxID=2251 RepID=A0A6G1Z6E8_9EURY|nr:MULTISPECIES: glycoside hydrolase family 16 protein [Haloferax]KAB1185480.1 family 16 glycosylhydrolase [Haloferax sp. CBA1149]MRW82130.1 family 16 glycosylhydrolase [Haloferax marinisediminis]